MKVSDYSRLEGMLHFDEDEPTAGLRLEFYHKESVLNVFGSRLKEVPIPLSRLGNIEHKQGWFSDKLAIRFRSLSDAESIPGASLGQMVVKVKKKERDHLRNLVVDVQLAMSQLRIDELESGDA